MKTRTTQTVLMLGSFALGVASTAMAMFLAAPGMMINETKSPLSHRETVDRIVETAELMGWKVPGQHEIHNSVAGGGYDVLPVTVIELCKVDLAGRILQNSDNRVVSSMMPCRIAVYENSDGEVIVSRMNTGLMSGFFGGEVESIMSTATDETEAILSSINI
jgi:uncharacterized protein (DUF302 family)